jgi:hypothetical protein
LGEHLRELVVRHVDSASVSASLAFCLDDDPRSEQRDRSELEAAAIDPVVKTG